MKGIENKPTRDSALSRSRRSSVSSIPSGNVKRSRRSTIAEIEQSKLVSSKPNQKCVPTDANLNPKNSFSGQHMLSCPDLLSLAESSGAQFTYMMLF
jgi:hypothetical protein